MIPPFLSELKEFWWITVWPWIKVIFPWGGWGILIYVFFNIYKNDEAFDRWRARFYKLLLWLGIKKDKSFIENDIRAKINSASKKLNKEVEGIISKGVKIVWVNEDTIESFLKKGVVLIRMRHSANQNQNTVRAACHYVSKGVLHTSKQYLPDDIRLGIELELVKRILIEEKEFGDSVSYFSKNVLDPALEKNKSLEEGFLLIEKMEKKGLFSRVLLREIKLLGKTIYPQIPDKETLQETEGFFYFLKPFTELEKGDLIRNWTFIKRNICIGILYVAKAGQIEKFGFRQYKSNIKRDIQFGAKNIYIFARQKNNITAAKEVAQDIAEESKKVERITIERYKTFFKEKMVPAVCIILKIYQ